MKRLLILFVLLVCGSKAYSAGTNFLLSATNTLEIIRTNRVALSNQIVDATTLMNSNLTWSISNLNYSMTNQFFAITNGVLAATNFAVVVPGPSTNWMRITNGSLMSITNAAP